MSEREGWAIDGELHLTVKTVAATYEVELEWVRRVVDLGLVRGRRDPDRGLLLPVTCLDRLAELLRLQRQLAIDLELLPFVLGSRPSR